MIREDRDPGYWNAIINAPDVRPTVGGEGPIDLTAGLLVEGSVPLACNGGGFIFVHHGYGRYELHTLFLKGHRGANVLRCFEAASRHMFTRTDCNEIVTKTAGSNRAAAFMARRAGFCPLFVRTAAWPDGTDVTHYTLTVDEWAQRDPTLQSAGHDFHQMLEAAKIEAGSALVTHPDDAAHDRAAGAAALMACGGHAEKAVWFYSRWAMLAGYQTIELLEHDPPQIDVRDAVVTVVDDHLEVVKCQL